jgi:hypothetical protein
LKQRNFSTSEFSLKIKSDQDGHIIYNLNSRIGKPCPNNYNPADFYVQVLAIEPTREQECRDSVKKICDAFAVSPQAQEVNEQASTNMGSMEKVAYFEVESHEG